MMTPKFRAWDVHEKRMLKVYRLSFDGPIEGVQVHCYLDDRDAEGSTEYSYDGDGLILEQSTGLKDTNGKEIYEGDIVEVVSQYWGELGNRYKVKFKKGMFTVKYDLLAEIQASILVIGNVHEDPELLEGKFE